jgi:ABC-2 type transport system permease protein
MNEPHRTGRLSTLAAAFVVARRDFTAILMSRSFIFFLLGPLFPLLVGGLAGGIGRQVQDNVRPVLGVAMSAPDVDTIMRARERLEREVPGALPDTIVIKRLAAGERFDPAAEMTRNHANLAAILTGSPASPALTGSPDRIAAWQGRVALLGAEASGTAPSKYPAVALTPIAATIADKNSDRTGTAQAAQTLLFLLTMLLAGMVLSNLVEEKGNKIIEILAAAVPMDAVFLGKLFAMLAVSLVGITVWSTAGSVIGLSLGKSLPALTAPAVGWPLFAALGLVYFSLGYLLLGSLFLTIGSLATTVREVQTLSMPVTMMQLLTFFFASYAMARPGSWVELAAIAVPFSSPFAMLARAAQDDRLWIHAAAIGWQVLCVAIFVRGGSMLFKRWVMKSGAASGARKPKRRWFRAAKWAEAVQT